jgi:hypothetical protein
MGMIESRFSLPQSSALRPQGWEVEVEVISTGLTDEQRALVMQVKQLSAMRHMAGLERAKRLMLLRESFPKVPPGSKGDSSKDRPGWAAFLRREFDTNVRDVNLEIAAIEAAGEKLDETGGGALPHLILQEIGSSHLNAIGRGSTPAIRSKVWDKLLDGKLKLNQRAILAEVKQLNSESGQVKLKATAPPKTPAAPKLPTRQNSGQGQGMSVSKWTAEGTPQGDRMDKEFAYLAGVEKGNETFQAAIAAARKGSGRSGKITRMQVLAAALHAECKAVSDRYQLENEKARDWKRYMTVWQHHWSDTDQLDMGASLKQIAAEMAEASRHFEIMSQLSWSDKVQLEE